MHIRREAIKVIHEVGAELLSDGSRPKVSEGELRGLAGLSGRLLECGVLVRDPGNIEQRPSCRGRAASWAPAQHRGAATRSHGEDHVVVLAAHIDIADHIVIDVPHVVGDPVEVGRGHVGVVG